MKTSEKILQYLDYKKINKNQFYVLTGLSNGYLNKKKNLRSDMIELIISKFPDLSAEWLITGQGNMIKTATIAQAQIVNEPQATPQGCKNCQRLQTIVDNQSQLIEKLNHELEECHEKLGLHKKKAS